MTLERHRRFDDTHGYAGAGAAIGSLGALVAACRALAGAAAGFSPAEEVLVRRAGPVDPSLVDALRALIEAGEDPLGEAFCLLRPPAERRPSGAVYTPRPVVDSMVAWAAEQPRPCRIVDPGCGSGRFLLAAGRRFPTAELVAVETDPLALLMLRANAAVLGLTARLTVHHDDYRRLTLPETTGRTLFIGNPPYVRHHDIDPLWKTWFAETARRYGLKASKLAGLHIHFFLKTRELGRRGDFGCFITAAEWLDVNYGAVLRRLLADGLGGTALHVLAPESMPFGDAITTGAVTCFHLGRTAPRLTVRWARHVRELAPLSAGTPVPWSALDGAARWTPII
ncbi:MAG: N-6 DNA methylase, partial [Rhodospirillaceae bacterium]|nr:N-6 DNA methylase [Rhodospirillaceae bacterium]